MLRRALLLVAVLALALSVRPAGAQPRQIGVSLAPGWNNIGYVGVTRPFGVALSAIAGKYESVWTWDGQAQRWLGANPLLPAAGDFGDLRQNQAYWIRMTAPGDVLMEVPPTQPAVTISPGWNNFVYPGPEQPITAALGPVAGRVDSVWRWDATRQGWNAFSPAAPMASDFHTLGPLRSYFLRLAPGAPLVMSPPAPAPGAGPAATPNPSLPGASPTPTASATPRPPKCRTFQSYQPQLAEVSAAQGRAAFGLLTPDPDFKIKDLETQPDGDGAPAAAYIPPTLLKAIGWVESGWRQATFGIARGATGPTITSSSCAYGLMQIITGMEIGSTPTAKQQRIGADFLANIAAGAQVLGSKWNLAPDHLPVVLPRNPRSVENWYYAVWAYHCYGDVCDDLGIHNNPEDPALKWPRPMYNSPDQLNSSGQFSFSDYPYQELVYGVLAHPPKVNNVALWQPLAVALPPRGSVGFPAPKPFLAAAQTTDPTTADALTAAPSP